MQRHAAEPAVRGATPSAKAVPTALWKKFSRVRSTARGSPVVPEV